MKDAKNVKKGKKPIREEDEVKENDVDALIGGEEKEEETNEDGDVSLDEMADEEFDEDFDFDDSDEM